MEKIELKTEKLSNGDIDVSVFYRDRIISASLHSSIGWVLTDYSFNIKPNYHHLLDWLTWLRIVREDFELVFEDNKILIECKNIPKWIKKVKKEVKEAINQETGEGDWGCRFSKDGKLDKKQFEDFLLSI